jgi:hypothetical protein
MPQSDYKCSQYFTLLMTAVWKKRRLALPRYGGETEV